MIMEEEEIPLENSTVSFNKRLSVAEKLNVIKYAEKRTIHVASIYYGVLRPAIGYWIKEKKINIGN